VLAYDAALQHLPEAIGRKRGILALGNILPIFRLCNPCGNILEPVMHKLETLAAVEHPGLDHANAGSRSADFSADSYASRSCR
jgi:hypothetical protein